MKYAVVLGDGMAGCVLDELGGKTTLEAAKTPTMDKLAKVSEQGLAMLIPKGMEPGSDTANLAVLGYDPLEYYTGRSPLEAISIGVPLGKEDVSFRMNLVSITEDDVPYEEQIILDHSAGEISTTDAAILVQAIKEELEKDSYEFHAGTSYRHLLVWRGGEHKELTPPHNVLGEQIGDYLPEDAILREMMEKGHEILKNHPINLERKRNGLNPANAVWFWGAGTAPELPSFEKMTGVKGALVSAVDLLKGIAIGTGLEVKEVRGANGGVHTNYKGKADAAIKALLEDGYDFAYIHIEAPDEMGHQGKVQEKIEAIEKIDKYILKRVYDALKMSGEDFKIMVLPDHPTPICKRTHTSDAVPYMIYDSTKEERGLDTYNEITATIAGHRFKKGHRLMAYFLKTPKYKTKK
jgi:2,3-bisphosphoglycerate-independent phosphoglycerate mutase